MKKEGNERHREILEILKSDYSSIISDYNGRHCVSIKPESPYPVWFCWWQGETAMPDVVKLCYSKLISKSNGHKINLITKSNYKEFVLLPEYILEKEDRGFISLANLSDVLRVALLSKYGGLWFDSTIFLLDDLPDFNTEVFSLKRLCDNNLVSECRWSTSLWYADKSSILFNFLQDILYAYCKNNDRFIDYFLLDYCIALGYENIKEIQNIIDNIPFSNPYVHWLIANLDNKYDAQLFSALAASTKFCKLTYKNRYQEKTREGLITYYGYIKSNL